MIPIFGTIFAGLLGLAFGSFLNVCLSRWPEGESVVQPRSHCRHCTHMLAWWENVPLLSWLLLRGRCRNCRAWIGWRYPLVEAALAALWMQASRLFFAICFRSEMPDGAIYAALSFTVGQTILYWLLVALAVFDAENLWLPDRITLSGIAIGFVSFLVQIELNRTIAMGRYGAESLRFHVLSRAAFERLLSILAAAGLILLIRWLYRLVRRREGLGLGDAKLMALLAAWLGLPQALLAFALGVVLGALVAVALLLIPSARVDRASWAASKLPLGTFLCVGGIVGSLWGQPILAAYLRWAGF
jgi:leader peptidase (prepilin peptidase)/N-methyltransferase